MPHVHFSVHRVTPEAAHEAAPGRSVQWPRPASPSAWAQAYVLRTWCRGGGAGRPEGHVCQPVCLIIGSAVARGPVRGSCTRCPPVGSVSQVSSPYVDRNHSARLGGDSTAESKPAACTYLVNTDKMFIAVISRIALQIRRLSQLSR